MSQTALSKKERYLLTVRGEETDHPPIWIMRQAGRYLPEYMAMRQHYSFHDFCLKPEVSAEATLLPLQLLDVDILIIFNDILIPLEEMGLRVEFPEGGPRIVDPLREEKDLKRFHAVYYEAPAVTRSLQQVRQSAGPDVPVLGFCGSPFTLALYAIEGAVSRNHEAMKQMLYEQPELLEQFLERITETAASYLLAQIREGGAHGVQIFESWGGSLAMPQQYERFAARWQRELIARVKRECPETPIHLYVRWSSGKLASMDRSGADVLSVDWMTPLAEARRHTDKTLQGNLDPMTLVAPDAVESEVRQMVEGFDWSRGWIANLGHGITPQANPEAAKRFVQCVHNLH